MEGALESRKSKTKNDKLAAKFEDTPMQFQNLY
jgi:hypothetical protein